MPFVRKARRPKDPNLRKPNSGLTKAEREIYDIYTKAFNGVRNQLGDQKVLNDILNSLQTNNISGIPAAFNWRKFLESLNGVVPTLSKQVADMATVHSKALPRKMTYEYSFEAKDPRAIAWAQTQAGKRVQGITLETQQAIANLISDGLRTKLTREEIIAELRQTVGLDKRQSRALGTFYEKRLNKYLEDGITYEEAAKKAEKDGNRYRVRLLKQRAIRIARTEISAAANAGRYLSWIEAEDRGLLPAGSTKRWITATDERTCPICQPMNRVEIPWTIPFTTGDQMPPAHPNCRCTAVIVPAEAPVAKHLQGKHDQKSHGRGNKVSFEQRKTGLYTELNMSDEKGEFLAELTYTESYQIEIHMINSRVENKGYATKVVDELYRRNPNETIFWGKTIEPASTHLAQKFSDKYGRTEFIPWGNGVIEGYEWGQLYGDPNPKVTKHLQGKHDQKTHGSSGGLKAMTFTEAYKGFKTSEDEQEALAAYSVDHYKGINFTLRNGVTTMNNGQPAPDKDMYKSTIAAIDSVIARAPQVKRDKPIWRVMSPKAVVGLEKGQTYVDRGFVSTTLNDLGNTSNVYSEELLQNFLMVGGVSNVLAKILPNGNYKGLSMNKALKSGYAVNVEEKEFLLPRNSAFTFLGFETLPNNRTIAVLERAD
jgi:SPP1 gp7 family putative phage head morphogenesis protein